MWNTPIIHGALMALISAVVGGVFPIIQAALNGLPVPALGIILGIAWKAGVAGVLAYLVKNGFLGSSNIPKVGPIIIIAFLLFASPSVHAQATNYNLTSPYQMLGIRGTNGDTVINTGTAADSFQLVAPYISASVILVQTKISGTVSDSCFIQASVDGLHWVSINQDTLINSNATGTQTKTWELPGKQTKNKSGVLLSTPGMLPYLWYRVQCKGVGTMKANIKSYIAPR